MKKKLFYITICLLYVPTVLMPIRNPEEEPMIINQENVIPIPVAPLYEPYVIAGKLIFISGQLPRENSKLAIIGKVGEIVSAQEGKRAAMLCGKQIIAQLKQAVNLQKVKRCVKLTGYVNATPDFTQHSEVINGASEVIIAELGERGKHARAAIGVASLPSGAAVEVEAIFELW